MSASIIDYLNTHALDTPEKNAFIFLQQEGNSDTEKRITYHDLLKTVQQQALQLEKLPSRHNMAILLYQHAADFILAFLACQYAGITAVPVPYVKGTKQFSRITAIIKDAGADLILCEKQAAPTILQELKTWPVLPEVQVCSPTADTPVECASHYQQRHNNIAFLQYTSGSTGMPKGVIITRENLLYNQLQLARVFGCDKNSVILSWLPFHHDMGLIGNILHTIYTGCTGVIMPPLRFIQSPQCWPEAISKYRVTHSGGPNFAYDLCVEKVPPAVLTSLDLSCWKVAYNGSEPVRASTMQQFSNHFRAAGFRPETFVPCYGLAEATLLVAGHKKAATPLTIAVTGNADGKLICTSSDMPAAQHMVSAGRIAEGIALKIIHPADGHICDECETGEICISGRNVSSGYWNKDNTGLFYKHDGRQFLRTGDLGFLYNNELFISGRIKEMLIVRGKNYYPYDMEQAVAEGHEAIDTNGVAIFSHPETPEHILVVAEIKRTFLRTLDSIAVISAIHNTLTGRFGISPYDILLLPPRSIPRTTSGKLQRVKCSQLYAQQGFAAIHSKSAITPGVGEKEIPEQLIREIMEKGEYAAIKSYLTILIQSKVIRLPPLPDDDIPLTELGIDSLRSMELINAVNRDLNINLDAIRLTDNHTLSGLTTAIENMLWLKNGKTSEKEITI